MTRRTASELFVVELAVRLTFKELAKRSAFLFSGPIGWILFQLAERLLGHMFSQGILYLDLARMRRQVNIEEKEYREAITKAYVHSKGKVISDEDKDRLRKLVISATRNFVRVRAQPKNT
jgi:hypothetical protein